MKRRYTHIKMLEPQTIKMCKERKSKQEIADAPSLTKIQVKNWVNRQNKQRPVAVPKKHGRPRKYLIGATGAMKLRITIHAKGRDAA